MGKIGKIFALILTLTIAISSLAVLTVRPASAQSLPTPAVPEFTIRLVNNSYATQPTTTTSTDPYTGKQTVITTPGQGVTNEYVEVSIKNPAFTPYTINYHNIDNRTVNLYFNVRSKGHFSEGWSVVDEFQSQIEDYSSQYTTFSLYRNNVPSPAQLDFEVQAVIGFLVNEYDPEAPLPPPDIWAPNFGINGTVSDWSNPQTLTIPASSTTTTSPSVPDFPCCTLPIATILVITAMLALNFKKRGHLFHFAKESTRAEGA